MNVIQANPYLARLRPTHHRVTHYTRTRDLLSMRRAHELAARRTYCASQLRLERAEERRSRARFLAYQAQLRAAPYHVELDDALAARVSHFAALGVPLRAHAARLGRAGEALLMLGVHAYERWRESQVTRARWSRLWRGQAKGMDVREKYAKLRWRRVKKRWEAVDAWKLGLKRRAERDSRKEGETRDKEKRDRRKRVIARGIV
ncbi:hypothetical protein OH77DRAFT_1515204 [Trametes cingulata]|nr:hypothetical protein OH77DRAFT_1515204 [Trametes cingulata]